LQAVLGGLAGEADVRVGRQRARVYARAYPQTSAAVSTISRSFATSSS
jgi:hypothetical protein